MMIRSFVLVLPLVAGFTSVHHRHHHHRPSSPTFLQQQRLTKLDYSKNNDNNNWIEEIQQNWSQICVSTMLAASLLVSSPVATFADSSTDGLAIAGCLFQKCPVPLAKCVASPNCLANLVCINLCNGKPDESECQVNCGTLFENETVVQFNSCALSTAECVPKKADDNSYPIPSKEATVQKFDSNLFEGKWYITAGQNKLFDTFDCQVHFFTPNNTADRKAFFAKLNWRIQEPDGEFFNRDAVQSFVQDQAWEAHLLNHDNDYLHYQDDWWIIDYNSHDTSAANDANHDKNLPEYVYVYYRGSNDAWDGYGGAVVYTKESKFPTSLLSRVREASTKVNFDFDKDFTITDNTCKVLDEKTKLLKKEQYVSSLVVNSEESLRSAAVLASRNAVNTIEEEEKEIEKLVEKEEQFIEKEEKLIERQLGNAVKDLSRKANNLEQELVKDITVLEKEVEKDVVAIEKEVEKDVVSVEKEVQGLFYKR